MKIKNNCARLITINYDFNSYKLMPAGESVEIPDEANTECKFLSLLLADRSVIITEEPKAAKESKSDLADLIAEAESLGIEVDKRWGEKKLKEAIAAANAE